RPLALGVGHHLFHRLCRRVGSPLQGDRSQMDIHLGGLRLGAVKFGIQVLRDRREQQGIAPSLAWQKFLSPSVGFVTGSCRPGPVETFNRKEGLYRRKDAKERLWA